jgi:hypothetical protein
MTSHSTTRPTCQPREGGGSGRGPRGGGGAAKGSLVNHQEYDAFLWLIGKTVKKCTFRVIFGELVKEMIYFLCCFGEPPSKFNNDLFIHILNQSANFTLC